MRASNQLTKTDQCEFHSRMNITQTSDAITRGNAQKNVLMRILLGEPIDDIQGEIDSILSAHKYVWENNEQRAGNLSLYEARIRRFCDYEAVNLSDGTKHIILPSDILQESETLDPVVDFFGEPVKVMADYFMLNDETNVVTVKKIKTGRFHSEKEDLDNYETYVLGLLGEKLFPDKQITVEIDHLADPKAEIEYEAIHAPYMRYKKSSDFAFTEDLKLYYQKLHREEMENKKNCTPSDCAGCSMNNICHFEEAPISVDIAQAVRPISEIRLTHAQQQVVNYEEGIARINAGAGAGKTLVVAMRIVELLKKGYEPEDICLLTFTNAGAGEMTARVIQYCAANNIVVDPERLTSTTFNAFCYQLVKDHYEELGFHIPPRVLPEETRSGIINRILDQYPRIEEWNYVSSAAQNTYYGKNTMIALSAAKRIFAEIKKEGYTRNDNPYGEEYNAVSLDLIFQMYQEFNNTLMERNFVEFDDQINQVFKLLQIHPTLFEEIGFKHIIVDEFQDTDLPQIKLLNAINDTASFKSFMAVGDDSQAIFSFRHTSPEYMINFERYFGRYDDFNLIENHRSTEDIISLANKINALNKHKVDKDLIATKPSNGLIPQIKGFYSRESEYRWIAEQIKEDIEVGKNPSDIAFLASTKTELIQMASILTEMGIPSILMNPIPYISNSRVAAITTLFEAFTQGTNRGLLDYQNALLHGALKGATSEEMESLSTEFENELRGQEKTAFRFIEYCKALDPDAEDECFQSFIQKFEEYTTLEEIGEFFRDFKLYGKESCHKREGRYEGVYLTTVHSAKGLEWNTTYFSLTKLSNERFSKNTRMLTEKQAAEKEEINRKWFVGTTRAREKLVMTGEFVSRVTKREMSQNEYVQKAYELLEIPYDYTAAKYWGTVEAEKATRKSTAREKLFSTTGTQKATKEEQVVLESKTGAVEARVSSAFTHDVASMYKDSRSASQTFYSQKTRTRGVKDIVSTREAYTAFCKGNKTDVKALRPTEANYSADVFGINVSVKPTVLIKDDTTVTIRQLRSAKNPLGDVTSSLEIPALALVAWKAFPQHKINVVIDEIGAFGQNHSQALKTTTIKWNPAAKAHYQELSREIQNFVSRTQEQNTLKPFVEEMEQNLENKPTQNLQDEPTNLELDA